MTITATEFKMNMGKYLAQAAEQDVFITKNGKVIAKLSNPYVDRQEAARSLFGILPSEASLQDAKAERLDMK